MLEDAFVPSTVRQAPTVGITGSIDPQSTLTRSFLVVADVLKRYHRHRALHLERVGAALKDGRPVLMVSNHAFNLVDPLLFLAEVYRAFSVVPHTMAHAKGWFRPPFLRDITARYGVVPSGSPDATRRALVEDRFLFLFPGGASEAALRDYAREPYRLKWQDRRGFLRLAVEHNALLLFVATVGNDEAYFQTRLPLPEALLRSMDQSGGTRYFGARLPVGFGPLTLPTQMTQVVSEPIPLGDRARALADETVFAALHARVWSYCQQFLNDAVFRARKDADALDRTTRGVENLLRKIGL